MDKPGDNTARLAALRLARRRLVAAHAARRRAYGDGDLIALCVSLQIIIIDRLIAARAGELPGARWRIPQGSSRGALSTESESPASAGRV